MKRLLVIALLMLIGIMFYSCSSDPEEIKPDDANLESVPSTRGGHTEGNEDNDD